uniref:THAP-type domain-containing protein n=1 Tax=Photinus pyralis TaxID=7054 RepID=A0A1Y1N3A8_PHOPY
MHGFPKNALSRKKWKILLRIDKPITNTMKVCSAHFTKEDYILPDVAHKRKCLKKTACPSRNLPQIRHQSAVNHEAKAKREDRYVRRQQLLEKAVRLEAADTLLLLANTEANTHTKEEEPVN